jgi:hypothetical protein
VISSALTAIRNGYSKVKKNTDINSEVFMAIIVQIVAFWVVTPCSFVGVCLFDKLISAYKTKRCHKPKHHNINTVLLQQHVQLYFRGETEKDHDEFWPEEQISGREALDFENATKGKQLVAFGGNS